MAMVEPFSCVLVGRQAVELLSKPQYEQFFVDLMMVKELNMQASICPSVYPFVCLRVYLSISHVFTNSPTTSPTFSNTS